MPFISPSELCSRIKALYRKTWYLNNPFLIYLLLSSAGSPPTFGSDEEKAMGNAIARAFPTSGRLVCSLHVKKKT